PRDAARLPRRQPAPTPSLAGHGMTTQPCMLVVDDEVDILDFIERVFRREYRVRRAQSVDEALVVMAAESLDVLITDHRMPRRSGFELLDRAQSLQPGAVRVLLTGYAELGEPPPGADAYVTKPVDGDTLRQVVRDARARKER